MVFLNIYILYYLFKLFASYLLVTDNLNAMYCLFVIIQEAVEKYDVVIQNLEFARDMQKQFLTINTDVSVSPQPPHPSLALTQFRGANGDLGLRQLQRRIFLSTNSIFT